MNRYTVCLVLVLAAFVAFQVQPNGTATANHAVTQVDACGLLAYSGAYELSSNLEHDGARSLSCITIGDSDITFSNPHGYIIEGDGGKGDGGLNSAANTGISIISKTGVVVEDQIVSNFANGIFLGGDVTGTVVRGNTTRNNTRWGIRTKDARNGIIYSNTANGNLEEGISLASSSNFDVSFNKVFGNQGFAGMSLQASSANRVTNNIVNSNQGTGIYLAGDDNVVTDNETSFNSANGIVVQGGDRNLIDFNRSKSNSKSNDSTVAQIQSGILNGFR